MPSLLDILIDVCDLGGLQRPTSVLNSQDATTRQLYAIANERGNEAVRLFDFPQLVKVTTLTLTANQIQTLPVDCAEVLDSTAWYSNDMTPLTGAITPQEWQRIVQTASAPIKFSFRTAQTSTGGRGLAFTPTPTGGETVSIFYRSKNWVKPRDWQAGISVTVGSYIYSDSQYWQTSTAGTTGGSAPTTANNGNDGAIIWVAQNSINYTKFQADTDESLIEPTVLTKGILARFYRMKGLEYEDLEAEYYSALRNDLAERNGGRSQNIFRYNGKFIDESNIKEGSW